MTHHDLTLLTIGFLIGATGVGILTLVRSALYDRWAEATAQKAEHTITSPPALGPDDWPAIARALTQFDGDFAEHTEQAHRRLAAVAPVVPIQRDRRGGATND